MYSREGAMRWERYSNHLDTLPQDDTPVLKIPSQEIEQMNSLRHWNIWTATIGSRTLMNPRIPDSLLPSFKPT